MSYFGTAAPVSPQTKPFYSICRDFSIHLFHHRMKACAVSLKFFFCFFGTTSLKKLYNVDILIVKAISGDVPLPTYVNLPSSAVRFAVDPFDDDVGGSKATGRPSIQDSFDSSLISGNTHSGTYIIIFQLLCMFEMKRFSVFYRSTPYC